MKNILLIFVIVILSCHLKAQDSVFSNVSINYNNTNGQGLRILNLNNSAYSTLQVNGSTGYDIPNWANSTVFESVPVSTGGFVISSFRGDINFQTNNRSNRMTITSGGNVGIGTSNPGNYKLNVMGALSSGVNDYSFNSATFQLTNESKVDGISGISPTGSFRWYTNPNNSHYDGFLYQLRAYDLINGESGGLLTVNGLGNLGIGVIDTKGFKLAVNGNIRAKEVKVETANWPDYVFEKDYQLPGLQEIEQHIKDKGHLPGIPSAEEVKTNGIDLGGMDAKLLKKIEELTLHLIEQNKTIQIMQKQIQDLSRLKVE